MLTTTDYIGIGVLITTFFTAFAQFVNAIRIKDIHSLVNGQTTAQNVLIATLHSQLVDRTKQVADAQQTAAVLAEGNKK